MIVKTTTTPNHNNIIQNKQMLQYTRISFPLILAYQYSHVKSNHSKYEKKKRIPLTPKWQRTCRYKFVRK